MADVQDLIAAIINKDALEVQNIFGELMASKVADEIDFVRPSVAESMFGEARSKCNECGYGMTKEDDACPKCAAGVNEEIEGLDEISPGLARKAAGIAGSRGQEHYYSAGSASASGKEGEAETHRKIGAAYWKQRDRLEAGAKKREDAQKPKPTAGVGAGKLSRLNTNEEVEDLDEISPGLAKRAADVAGSRGQEHYYSAGSASAGGKEKEAETHRKIGAAYWKQRDRLQAGAKKREDAQKPKPTTGVGAGKLSKL